jgi:hypothetical protein
MGTECVSRFGQYTDEGSLWGRERVLESTRYIKALTRYSSWELLRYTKQLFLLFSRNFVIVLRFVRRTSMREKPRCFVSIQNNECWDLYVVICKVVQN